jgi:hypothetical protein
MEEFASFCNVIEIFFMKKSNPDRKRRAFWPFEISHGIGTIM